MRRLAPLLCLVVACHTAAASRATVDMAEYSITPDAEVFAAGQVDLEVRNTGTFGHTLVVSDGEGNIVAALDVLPPGEETTVSLDLAPGEYQLTCRIVGQDREGNLVDHYQRGMLAAVTVEGT